MCTGIVVVVKNRIQVCSENSFVNTMAIILSDTVDNQDIWHFSMLYGSGQDIVVNRVNQNTDKTAKLTASVPLMYTTCILLGNPKYALAMGRGGGSSCMLG